MNDSRRSTFRTPTLLGIALGAVLFAAGAARAELVAGWDFSQYLGDGLLSIDGTTYTETLGANYSHRVAAGLGPAAAAFGTMYLDGTYGSTAVGAGSGSEPILPSAVANSLASNLDAPVEGAFLDPFDAYTLLIEEGQQFANLLAMTALADASIAFEADRGETPPAGYHWFLSFGARTQQGDANVAIDFSGTGTGFGGAASFPLTATDTRYSVDLGPAAGPAAFVRFAFTNAADSNPLLDNVAISVPEAGGAAQLAGAAAVLGALAFRRRA
jgi:hypothetical protein